MQALYSDAANALLCLTAWRPGPAPAFQQALWEWERAKLLALNEILWPLTSPEKASTYLRLPLGSAG